jgi:membrane-associated phospholipid phosphatase
LLRHSFPSGHTCAAFSLFTFLSLLASARYQPLGLLFFILAALVGYTRMYLAAHFFADVYAGSILGTIGTILLWQACLPLLRSRGNWHIA